RRLRLDLTVPATTHRRNHITSPSFRRSSETAEPPPKPSIFFKPVYPNFHHPKTKAGGDGAVEASISRNQNPNYNFFHYALASKQPRLHSKNRDTTGGVSPELRQGGRRRRWGEDKDRTV
ncbi:unnamed protein product, partial [Brassica rapa]